MSHMLALLRHGQSSWNLENRFTGWHDCPLSDQGRQEARNAGEMLRRGGVSPDVVHTSLLVRAIDTAHIVLSVLAGSRTFGEGGNEGTTEIEMRQDWRLNERHYGDLTGLNKDETRAKHGAEQVHSWRRSYTVTPPPITEDNPWNPNGDPRYAAIKPPLCESLADVTKRLIPCFEEIIAPDLLAGKSVLVVAHGNSLRALVKHLSDISDEDIPRISIPTGVPLVYRLDDSLRPTEQRELIDRYLS